MKITPYQLIFRVPKPAKSEVQTSYGIPDIDTKIPVEILDGIGGIGSIQLGNGLSLIQSLVGKLLITLEACNGVVGARDAGGHLVDALLSLCNGNLALDGFLTELELFDVACELIVHIAHLLGIVMRNCVIGLKIGELCGKSVLLGEESSGIILIAGGKSLNGVALHLVDACLTLIYLTLAGFLLSHNGSGFLLNLNQVVVHVAQALVNHLLRILYFIEKSVDVRRHNVFESG